MFIRTAFSPRHATILVKNLALASACILWLAQAPSLASAQSTMADIKAQSQSLAEKYNQVDQMLANTDKNQRISAMVALLRSGDPIYQKRAREAGLFSPDPEMRLIALRALIDTGGPYRVDILIRGVDEEKTNVRRWLRDVEGSWDDSTGFANATFTIGPYDDKKGCWRISTNSSNCRARLTGETVTFFVGYSVISLKLQNDGRLIGNFRYNNGSYQPLPAAVDFIR